ncbi:MAG: hypothetical protein ACOX5Z_02655 [Desulfobulbus sp.]|jgi:hypothetical protein
MKKIISTVAFASMMLLSTNALADVGWAFKIDNSDFDNVFDIYFVADEETHVENWCLDFFYDAGEMRYLSYTNTPPSGWYEFLGPLDEKEPGELVNLTAGYWFGNPWVAAAGSSTKIGTLTFEIFDTAIADGEKDLWFGQTIRGGVSIDDDFNPDTIATVFHFRDYPEMARYGEGLDVGAPPAPVPVPGTLGLVAVGLVGLAGITRRRDDV